LIITFWLALSEKIILYEKGYKRIFERGQDTKENVVKKIGIKMYQKQESNSQEKKNEKQQYQDPNLVKRDMRILYGI
jgi:hypothetical protein